MEGDGNLKEIRYRYDLSRRERISRDNATAYQDEITFLNSKLEEGLKVEGFVFKIVPEDYKRCSEESYSNLTFFSREEYEEKQSDIRAVSDWSNWQPSDALPCWGVRIKNIGKDDPSERSCGNSNQETSKVLKAIVTEARFHQVREFDVNVTLNEEAIKEAKKIIDVSKQERQNTFKKFNDKYCSVVYSGKFSAGCWLRTVATARCVKPTKGQDAKYLEKCATEEIKHWWSRDSQANQLPPRNKDASVILTTVRVSDPPNIYGINHLRKKIAIFQNCTVFPANWREKSHFIPVYKIMQSQAEANNDEVLREVSDIFKQCMKGKISFHFGGISEYLLR